MVLRHNAGNFPYPSPSGYARQPTSHRWRAESSNRPVWIFTTRFLAHVGSFSSHPETIVLFHLTEPPPHPHQPPHIQGTTQVSSQDFFVQKDYYHVVFTRTRFTTSFSSFRQSLLLLLFITSHHNRFSMKSVPRGILFRSRVAGLGLERRCQSFPSRPSQQSSAR